MSTVYGKIERNKRTYQVYAPVEYGGRITMEAYKQEFIEFMVESDVLKFGEFTLKSGRKSPFFMNAGAYVTLVHSLRSSESIMQKQFMRHMEMTLMYCSDLHTRESRLEL